MIDGIERGKPIKKKREKQQWFCKENQTDYLVKLEMSVKLSGYFNSIGWKCVQFLGKE